MFIEREMIMRTLQILTLLVLATSAVGCTSQNVCNRISECEEEDRDGFSDDAAAVCAKAPPRCPPARRLPAALIARVTKMQQALSSPAAITASSWRRRDLQDVARIRPVLLALQQQTVRPDLHTDLVVVADRLQRRGQTADAAVLRAFDVALYPPPPPRKTAP